LGVDVVEAAQQTPGLLVGLITAVQWSAFVPTGTEDTLVAKPQVPIGASASIAVFEVPSVMSLNATLRDVPAVWALDQSITPCTKGALITWVGYSAPGANVVLARLTSPLLQR
jgi:hypothetical protein